MSSRRLHESLGDYVAVAISPALIMALVGSLTFFLLELFYHGPYDARLRWVMFWFVMAAVLIARISMVEGAERAGLYGLALGVAVMLVIVRFIGAFWGPALLLGVAWWCAHRLTWDCTRLDHAPDANGKGLLDAAGLDEAAATRASAQDVPPRADDSTTATEEANLGPKPSPWRRLLLRPDRSPNRPAGVTVIYFSLAALPIFGLGQGVIAAVEPGRRRYTFGLLCVYLTAALGLLMATSFLSLRRYLRQRRLEMPVSTVTAWLGTGSAVAVAILLLALLFPKPQAEYSAPSLLGAMASRVRQASRWSALRDSPAQGEGRASNRPAEKPPTTRNRSTAGRGAASDQSQSKATGKSSSSKTGSGRKPKTGADSSRKQPGDAGAPGHKTREKASSRGSSSSKQGSNPPDAGSGSGKGKQKASSGKSSSGKSTTSSESRKGSASSAAAVSKQRNAAQKQPQRPGRLSGNKSSSSPARPQSASRPPAGGRPHSAPPRGTPLSGFRLLHLLRWLIVAALIAAAIVLLIRYPREVADWLGRLWAALVDLWRDLFGWRRKKASSAPAEVAVVKPRRPFASFVNPLENPSVTDGSTAELIRYSFEALEAWAAEHETPREPGQTCVEFCQQVADRFGNLSPEVRKLGVQYARVAYARAVPTDTSTELLSRLWSKMTATKAPRVEV